MCECEYELTVNFGGGMLGPDGPADGPESVVAEFDFSRGFSNAACGVNPLGLPGADYMMPLAVNEQGSSSVVKPLTSGVVKPVSSGVGKPLVYGAGPMPLPPNCWD